jgi:GAF domain-containing protein
MAVDGQLLARTVGELRAAVPRDGDLLVGLGRVVAATRVVVGVDGTGRTLVHEDGRPRWVAVSDAAMELLEQVQHDVGEGPVGPPLPRTGWWRSRTYSASGSGAGLLWWSASCGCGGLSVPVRLAGQPVGTLDVEVTQPRAWSPGEVEGLGRWRW